MLNDFLNNTCDIIETSVAIVSWEQIKTENTIYTWIPCHFYNQTWNVNETVVSENTILTKTRIIIEPDKTLVKEGMKVKIYDPDLWDIWTYQINDSPKMNRLSNWTNDSIQFSIKSI